MHEIAARYVADVSLIQAPGFFLYIFTVNYIYDIFVYITYAEGLFDCYFAGFCICLANGSKLVVSVCKRR